MPRFPIHVSRAFLAAALMGSLAAAGPALAGKGRVKRDLSAEQAPIADVGEGPGYHSSIQVEAFYLIIFL